MMVFELANNEDVYVLYTKHEKETQLIKCYDSI